MNTRGIYTSQIIVNTKRLLDEVSIGSSGIYIQVKEMT